MIMHFRSFRLQPPHAPPSSGNASCSGRALPPIRFVSLSAVLRTSHFSSCLISRIRPYRVCVATLVWAAVLRTIRSLPVALHPVSPRRSYFQFLAGSSAREGLSPSCARSLSSALESVALRQTGSASSGATNPRRAPATESLTLMAVRFAHPFPAVTECQRKHAPLATGLVFRQGSIVPEVMISFRGPEK